MDQQKIGEFLKTLRREKQITQEQLAERLNVSRRTVSRWETGSNLPDLSILVELSDYYEVDLRELLDGERKSEKMEKELEDTVKKVAEYSSAEKRRTAKMTRVYVVLIAVLMVNLVIDFLELDSPLFGFIEGMTIGIVCGAAIIGILYTTGALAKVRAFKMRLLGRKDDRA